MMEEVVMAPARLHELVAATTAYVDPRQIPDYAVTGLQIEGSREAVRRIAVGVSANRDLFRAAADWDADAVLVHHGLFWDSDDPDQDPARSYDERRAAFLRDRGMSLIAYHLPLDAHPEVGNNRQIADKLGLVVETFDFAPLPGAGVAIGLVARAREPLATEDMLERAARVFGQAPTVIAGGPAIISRMAIVSGGGASEIYAAIDRGLDAYLTGEGREWIPGLAREGSINFFAVGHHASEVGGVQALAHWMERQFGVETRFFPQANPF
ncbi:MAG: Nif3-like dinuclear metal center hexameric protein [Thermomicrobiales bacterium]|nr:Nif3-like dinuclear metal center hexameric protein [Thermomicrobiales bacterium]